MLAANLLACFSKQQATLTKLHASAQATLGVAHTHSHLGVLFPCLTHHITKSPSMKHWAVCSQSAHAADAEWTFL
eukprot:m.35104 g.35104  ORF g.35104 m.35104 type:complete len:75 (-) comp10892_c0_seq2:674-898(-)